MMFRRSVDEDGGFNSSMHSLLLERIHKNKLFVLYLSAFAVIIASLLFMYLYPDYKYSAYGVITGYDSSGYWVTVERVAEDTPVGVIIENPVNLQSGLCGDSLNILRCQLGAKVKISKYENLFSSEWWMISGFVLEWDGDLIGKEEGSGSQAEVDL